ncbi:unnamed protein product [Didymodactylos carnosus]|uniref:Ig-like domain-containing protein n=1 Tax=Didymodactylos carnosus TaxID=1234261 RepID=A0A813QUP2_9BILA|nr:unnamed protein product [Didymodactylos carnosus]CAF1068930.1 unnamed protein product [Didymodactylos carnosus]CAF3553568.1 unnamed protein product [Didymodactylos carnosus]CAF3833559.1 unnamed protein product [Didymodactylos carnosus]
MKISGRSSVNIRVENGRNGQYLQTIVVQPKSAQILFGETVTLECTVFNQFGNVAWCKDGHCTMGRERPLYFLPRYEIVGDKSAGINSLKILNVSLDDDGIYQCQIGRTVEALEALSDFANLTVLVPPNKVDLNYVSPAVISDKEFQMNCIAYNSRPSTTFLWKFDSAPVVNVTITKSEEAMQTNSKLLKTISTITIKANINQHGKEITCEVTHPALNIPITASSTIAVDYQPVVKLILSPSKLKENEIYWFECMAESRPAITQLVWKVGDSILDRMSPTEDGKYPLKLIATREMHDKNLTCIALNSAGVSQATIALTVYYSPKFRSVPQPYTLINIGDALSLTCDVDANPHAGILWFKDGTIVGGGKSYQIPDVTEHDFGLYACVASLGQFTKIFATTKVLAPGPPRLFDMPSVLASLRSMAVLKCHVEKDTEPTDAYWMFNNVTLSSNMKYDTVSLRDTSDNRYETSLMIRHINKQDLGQYECYVTNQYGTSFKRVRLQKRDSYIFIQTGIYGAIVMLLSVLFFLLYLYCKHATKSDRKRATIKRMRKVQTWLKSKPSMWIHSAPHEKIPLTVYDEKSGVTRTTLGPAVDIVECYVSLTKNLRNTASKPLPIATMPFCYEDDIEQIYETADEDQRGWQIDV